MQKTKIKKIMINICILFIVVLLFLIFAEIFFRLFGICEVAPEKTGSLFTFFKKSENLELAYELKPNSEGYLHGKKVKINSRGLRDYEYSLKKPKNTYRIAIIGDSITFGSGVNLDETYSKILEQKLKNELNMNVEVLNFGVPAYTGSQEFVVLNEKAINYEPDLIIFGHFLNDPDNIWHPFDTAAPIPFPIKIFFNEHSCFYAFLKKRWNKILNKIKVIDFTPYKELYYEDSEFWKNHKKRLENISKISNEKNIPILFVLLPRWRNLNESYDFKDEHVLLNKTIIKSGMDCLDIFLEVEGLDGEKYTISLTDAAHPTYEGHKIISNAIYEKLIHSDYFPNKSLIEEKYCLKNKNLINIIRLN